MAVTVSARVPVVEALTPRQIVAELDKYVVGQHKAKRAVAIALRTAAGARNWRRSWPKRSRRRTS